MISWAVIGTALWLGILTSISPCPLATNIAAVSFVSRRVGRTYVVLLTGLFYTLGRTLSYVVLGWVIIGQLLASDEIARFLQRYLNEFLGPVLVLVGMVLLELLGLKLSLQLGGERLQARAAKGGIGWALVLGIVFALSFCPVSAGLFFGGLVPLAVKNSSRIMLSFTFGVGTALPVVAFALLIAFASQHVGRAFTQLTQVEKWARIVTGIVFIAAGLYLSLIYIYDISMFA